MVVCSTAQDIAFSHLKIENGLSQNSVLAIAQDARGFMWLGTRYGLNRYDGSRFYQYLHNAADSSSISDNYINTLFVDSRGCLWVGTQSGLQKFLPETNAFEHIVLSVKGKRVSPAIYSMVQDAHGRYWVGTSAGLFVMDADKPSIVKNASELLGQEFTAANTAICLYQSKNGDIWIGSFNGLVQAQEFQGKFKTSVFRSAPNNANGLADGYIRAVTEDKKGNIWIGCMKGVYKLTVKDGQFTSYTHSAVNSNSLVNDKVRALLTDDEGRLWVGTQEGLSLFNEATNSWSSYQYNKTNPGSLSQNSVHSIFMDPAGSVWVGTFFGGANVYHRQLTGFTSWQYDESNPGISNNVVSAVAADKQGDLWIATEGGGLNYHNRQTGSYQQYKNIPGNAKSIGSNLIKSLCIDNSDNLWVGTHGQGLCLFHPQTGNFDNNLLGDTSIFYKQSEIASIYEDSRNELWIGKHAGLIVMQRTGTTLTPAPVNKALASMLRKNISAITEDASKNIWLGTLKGLFLFDRAANSVRPVHLLDTSGTENINCIQEDGKGNMLIGVYYGGLIQYNKSSGKITRYTHKDGLPNDNVVGVLEDANGDIWVSTSNGLVKFNSDKKSFLTYTRTDGLPGNEFNYNAAYTSPAGEMFFGSMDGLISFYPEKINRNNYEAPLVFTGFKLFNDEVAINDVHNILDKDISFTQQLLLAANQNSFTVQFALLNYIKADKNRYAYQLKGVNSEWIETAAASATFNNLMPGNYTLLVKGANNDGVWGKPIEMKIKVLAPWWKRWWAYTLYALLTAGVLFILGRFLVLRALFKKEDELHQLKLNFFTNVSHEIRTHLTLVLAPVDTIERENKGNLVLQRHLSSVKRNANTLLNLVTELMDFRKAESRQLKMHIEEQDLVHFLTEIYTSYEDLSLSKDIHLSFVHNVDQLPCFFDKMQIEKVFYNLLSNAFKFTPGGGSIRMEMVSSAKEVQIKIIDNGRGIAKENLAKIFVNYFQADDQYTQNSGYGIGLALAKNIVELHGGSITAESVKEGSSGEQYTCFTVKLPLGFAALSVLEKGIPKHDEINTDKALVSTVVNETDEHKFTLLLAEDNQELNSFLTGILKQSYNVSSYYSGLEAWENSVTVIPDLIITDVMMPGIDGFELCKRIKQDIRTSHIPVVMLTAKSTQADHIGGLSTGADLYLTKPVNTQVLELSIRNLLISRETMRRKFSDEFSHQPLAIPVVSADEEFVQQLTAIIKEHMANQDFGVEMLSVKATMSQSVLYKKVKAVTNMSVNDFVKSVKLKAAAELLLQKKYTVSEISYMVGFNDWKYFGREFKKAFGLTPTEYADS